MSKVAVTRKRASAHNEEGSRSIKRSKMVKKKKVEAIETVSDEICMNEDDRITMQSLPPVPSDPARYWGPQSSAITRCCATSAGRTARNNNYNYEPLSKGRFRLLKLFAGRHDDQLRASLVSLPIAAASNKYIAISYAWGRGSSMRRKLSMGRGSVYPHASEAALDISPTVDTLLRHIRRDTEETVVWVDSVCINQSNAEEKSTQVAEMHNIYAGAARVLIWLGEGTAQQTAGMESLASLLRPEGPSMPRCMAQAPTYSRALNAKSLTADNAITDLLNSSWFSRGWTLQELMLSRRATINVGDMTMDWADFRDATSLWDSLNTTERSAPTALYSQSFMRTGGTQLVRKISSWTNGEIGIDTLAGRSRRDLSDLLTMLRSRHTSDPRDRVYSMLALASDGSAIQPDYTKSATEVYRDLYTHVIAQQSSIDIINRHWNPPSVVAEWESLPIIVQKHAYPSWVPTWDGHSMPCPLTHTRDHETSTYDATHNHGYGSHELPWSVARAIATEPKHAGTQREAITMTLRGTVLGRVADLSTRMAEGIVLRECLEMGGISLNDSKACQELPERLWRTLVANRDSELRPAPPLFRLAFINLYNQMTKLRSIDTTKLLKLELEPYIRQFLNRVQEVVWNRRTFIASPAWCCESDEEQLFGLAPEESEIGDSLVLIYGLKIPLVMRIDDQWSDDDDREIYTIVGEAYVDGMMQGEAWDGKPGRILEDSSRDFTIR